MHYLSSQTQHQRCSFCKQQCFCSERLSYVFKLHSLTLQKTKVMYLLLTITVYRDVFNVEKCTFENHDLDP